MSFTHAHPIRFLVMWSLSFLIIHFFSVMSIVATVLYSQDNFTLVTSATLLTPIISLAFAFWFFRGVRKLSTAAIWEISGTWFAMHVIIVLPLTPFLYGIPWTSGLSNTGFWVINIFIFLSVLIPGFYRQKYLRRGMPEVDLLHGEMLGDTKNLKAGKL